MGHPESREQAGDGLYCSLCGKKIRPKEWYGNREEFGEVHICCAAKAYKEQRDLLKETLLEYEAELKRLRKHLRAIWAGEVLSTKEG